MPQELLGCTSTTIITESLSSRRKIRCKPKLAAIGSDIDSMPVSLDNFVKVLEHFMSDARYNGFRIYFAAYSIEGNAPGVPPDRHGKLTVLFVPTIGRDNEIGGENDPYNWYHLYGDDIMTRLPAPGSAPANADLVTIWTNNYLNYMVADLESDGRTKAGSGFQETLSLWYSRLSISGSASVTEEIGLLRFIRCGRQDPENPIVDMKIFFAAFLPKADEPEFPYDYKLTVTFNLRQKNDPVGTLDFGSKPLLIGLAPADTGLPCPPKGNCPVQTT